MFYAVAATRNGFVVNKVMRDNVLDCIVARVTVSEPFATERAAQDVRRLLERERWITELELELLD